MRRNNVILAIVWLFFCVWTIQGNTMKKSHIKLANRAEKEIKKFVDNNYLWLKHICNFECRPPQVVWADEIEKNPYIVIMAPPRFGKTNLVELMCLKDTATHPWEEGRTWAPKEDQAKNSLKYQLSAIENSEVLSAYIAVRDGKRQKSTKHYEFWNGSNWKIFGQNSNFEGENATIIRAEEFDDMDWDIWTKRIIERGSAKNRNGLPTRIRITGTIQEGKGNMYRVVEDPEYYTATLFDVYDGLALGIYDEKLIEHAKKQTSPEDWLRIYLLKFTEAKNYLWEKWIRHAQKRSIEINYEGVPYEPGGRYDAQGRVVAGLDMGHSGESKTASYYSFQVWEIIGNTAVWLNGKRWPPTANTKQIKEEVIAWWDFYRIDYAYGDALKADMIADINDMLYAERLISVDRSAFPENSPSNWKNWVFSPVWNTGQTKWNGAQILQSKLRNGEMIIPYFAKDDDGDTAKAARSLVANFKNIKQGKSNARYGILEPIKPEIGDDDFDASWMALLCANDRLPTIVNLDNLGRINKQTVITPPTCSIVEELKNDLYSELDIERNF